MHLMNQVMRVWCRRWPAHGRTS